MAACYYNYSNIITIGGSIQDGIVAVEARWDHQVILICGSICVRDGSLLLSLSLFLLYSWLVGVVMGQLGITVRSVL